MLNDSVKALTLYSVTGNMVVAGLFQWIWTLIFPLACSVNNSSAKSLGGDGGLGWRVVNCTGGDGVSKPREPHWFTAATWNWYHQPTAGSLSWAPFNVD